MSESLEKKIAALEKRNLEKDTNKAWETSLTRRFLVAVGTYLTVGLFMAVIGVQKPWVNAVIPSLGFFLSTLSLPLVRNLWVKYIFKSK